MNARELIMTSVLGCGRADLCLGRRKVSEEEQTRCDQMIARFEHGEPLQYILGETEFLGLRLGVDERVLIPRPETELMADALLRILSSDHYRRELNILDVGTGSGCLAISLVKHGPSCRCDAVDVSADALAVARQNARVHGVDGRITFHQGDIRRLWPVFLEGSYDLIVSNPPYIPTRDWVNLPGDVKREPRIALDGGPDGLMFYRDLIPSAARLLKPDGILACEFGDGQDRALRVMFDASWSVEWVKDFSGVNRFFIAKTAS